MDPYGRVARVQMRQNQAKFHPHAIRTGEQKILQTVDYKIVKECREGGSDSDYVLILNKLLKNKDARIVQSAANAVLEYATSTRKLGRVPTPRAFRYQLESTFRLRKLEQRAIALASQSSQVAQTSVWVTRTNELTCAGQAALH